jgi:argininosuccinate lyase
VAANSASTASASNSLDAVIGSRLRHRILAPAALIDDPPVAPVGRADPVDEPALRLHRSADRFCTGSSIMPQKKNPDVPELVRGKTGRVNGHLVALLTLMKSQPLAYNKDNQEDKEPLFDTVDTVVDSLRIYADMLAGLNAKEDGVRPENMRRALTEGFATATDLADYLVKKGLPFRDAHGIVARAVKAAEVRGCDLPQLSLEDLREFSPVIETDVHAVLTVEGSLASRAHTGGTAPEQVCAAIARARAQLG